MRRSNLCCLILFTATFLCAGSSSAVVMAQNNSDASGRILERLDQLESNLKKQNSWLSPSNAMPLLAALGGWILALYVTKSSRRAQEREKMKEHLFDALKWFEKGTQKRSIGLSVIEANWDDYRELRPVWQALLINQALHLLTMSGQRNSPPEHNNLGRIMSLLEDDVRERGLDESLNINLLKALANANTTSNEGVKNVTSDRGIFVQEKDRDYWLFAFALGPAKAEIRRVEEL
jgi:hypothetical protein